MTVDDIGAATARLLIEAGAIQISRDRPYVLAAGWASPVYVDCRLLIGEPRFRNEAVRLAAEAARGMLEPGSFGALAGAETAGIPSEGNRGAAAQRTSSADQTSTCFLGGFLGRMLRASS